MGGADVRVTGDDGTGAAIPVVVEFVVDVVATGEDVATGETDMAPTAADFKTAMTDSSRDPAGPPPPDGVFGVAGARAVIVGGWECVTPSPLWDDGMDAVAPALSTGFVETFSMPSNSIVFESPDDRGSSFILTNSLTPHTKSSFCREAGALGCRAMCTVKPL